jgi:HSP20 family molecular chaperone IbpA
MTDVKLKINSSAESQMSAEPTQQGALRSPSVDIFETEKMMILIADMPGVSHKDVDVRIENSELRIGGIVASMQGGAYILSEFSAGNYFRVFTLSSGIDQAKVSASFKNGVLRLTLPKIGVTQPKKISVRSES